MDEGKGRCRTGAGAGARTLAPVSLLAAIGLVTLISGTTTLNRRKASQSKIDQEIQNLNRKRSGAVQNFDAHIQLGERTMLSLSWTF